MRVTFEEQRLSALITDQPPDAPVCPKSWTTLASALLSRSSCVSFPATSRV